MFGRERFAPLVSVRIGDLRGGFCFESPGGCRYEIREVAQGGLSRIFKAQLHSGSSQLGSTGVQKKDVCIKGVVLPYLPSEEELDLFILNSEEYSVLTSLTGVAGVPAAIEYMALPPDEFRSAVSLFSLSWLEGKLLSTVLADNRMEIVRLSPKKTAGLCLGLLRTLCHVHDRGVLHNDIKPQNIIMHPDIRLSVFDFNIATRIDGGNRRRIIRLTPEYAAPEVVKGERSVSGDMYALGLVMASILLGREVCGGSGVPTTDGARRLLRVVQNDFDKAMYIQPHLAQAVVKAIEPRSGDRHTSTRAFLDAFRVSVHVPELLAEAQRLGVSLARYDLEELEERLVETQRCYGDEAVCLSRKIILEFEKALLREQIVEFGQLKDLFHSAKTLILAKQKLNTSSTFLGFILLINYIEFLCKQGLLSRRDIHGYLIDSVVSEKGDWKKVRALNIEYANKAFEVAKKLY